MLVIRQARHHREPLPSSSMGVGAPDSGSLQSKTCVESSLSEVGEGTEGVLRGSTEPPHQFVGSSTTQIAHQQQMSARAPLLLTPREVEDISELCLQVIVEHEAEKASISSPAPLQRPTNANSVPAATTGSHGNGQIPSGSQADLGEGTERSLSHPSSNPGPFAAYEAFTHAAAQQLHATSATDSGEASQDPSVPEQVSDAAAGFAWAG